MMASKKRRKVVETAIRNQKRKDRIGIARKLRAQEQRAIEKERDESEA